MAAASIYDFEAVSITGQPAHLSTQRGKVLLIVNTASACGFTPQFAGLERLWQDYRDRGLVVVGFPSNEFGAQAHPLWQWLKAQAPGLLGTEGVKWNFTKFLVGRDGKVRKRYAPNDAPEALRKDIEEALAA